MRHKKYIVFEMAEYYPSGGLMDIVDSFDNKDVAIDYLNSQVEGEWYEYGYIIDRDTWDVVYTCNCVTPYEE